MKKNIRENSKFINKKTVIINKFFFKQPDEVVFRSFSDLIHEIGNKTNFTRGKKVIGLI